VTTGPRTPHIAWPRIVAAIVIALALFLAFITPVRAVCEGTIPIDDPSAVRLCGPDRGYQVFVVIVGLLVALPLLVPCKRRSLGPR
jgi:hypothetical protein